ncbi:MAG: bifunctional phosphopantothenoylcysteine decarboxylase/phosphopantothenate--cysteine ligase CoaBC [Methylotenera sp.]|uniref:bifunctional phosphopantothenoylcysteine decarboxylase/phosphopantothenate--cysteine ligase CoaBC n=1 Tax=Methylotenera sp. TaxID=2051956 RepID=UPI00271D47F6|nr:bifunctional phosphopantothenoylcysteine decarboxylase/phosphopantothenate--cysteine ligase CoaBC [Methylotenera sp.]MDO9394081.1 bifunctional phosphopantothenoylcysteine decarboxylase/phosphopantothenate--cysteine ligase CoaBC [Methylotenera sp.]MDP1522067.1 bifunctional phosphopantothenoylcysteine decarboxylase/phosphopantothenate--cysteine ligase CoaBC [Methylotenera sp.]
MQKNKSSVLGKLVVSKLVLGITGGIAAYKAAELVRLLVKAGIDVQVVMTSAACQFITPVTMQALSGKPVFIDMWDSSISNGMPHIELSRNADAILVAPASADFIAKLVHGRADDLLSTLCLARDCPLLVAPAMNKQMWENPATQRNIKQLKADGISILGPDSGEQACGEVGLGRMLEAEALLALVNAHFTPKLLAGKRVLITAGATLEMIDPVRAITNLSSGKMGYAIAQAAADMGAEVTLVSGATTLNAPSQVNTVYATSAQSMYQAVMSNIATLKFGTEDIFISVAAVADYRPVEQHKEKIKKSSSSLTIELTPNKDILSDVASLPNAPFCVGFAAETENLLEYAEAKRQAKKLPLIVANLAIDALGSDENQVTLLDKNGAHPLERAPKPEVAILLLQHVANMLQ